MHRQIEDHVRVAQNLITDIEVLEKMADRLLSCFSTGNKVLLLGNGGSAADAQHIAAELSGRFKRDRKALPALALTTDTSVLTAVGNDLGFERIFSRQIEALANSGDVVWALSVSGSSPNVLTAMQAARQHEAICLGFTSRRGAALREMCDLSFAADHDDSDRVQEIHALAYHLICDRIEKHFCM